jgi:hypothetical protein
MAKDIEVDINVNNNIEGSIAQLKALKRELKNTAVGTEEFKNLFNQIDDLEDKIKSAKNVSSDWIDSLESAGGPIGMLGAGLNKAKVATQSFGSALKATGIGLVVAAVGGLVAAFSESETAMKKLEPLFIGLEKILGGIFKVFEPLLDAFIDLALRALPYITKGIGGFYSGLFALFTLVKNVGMGAGKILKGIFTLDFDALKEGYTQLTGSWNAAVEEFKAANKRFEAGSNELTKTEKKNVKERVAVRKTEKKEKDKVIDSELAAMREFQGEYENYLKQLQDLQKQYNTEIEDMQAVTEQQKLDLWYKRRAQEIDAITKDNSVKNELYASLETQRAIKQAEIEKKKEDELTKIRTEGEDARLAYEAKQALESQKILEARLQAQLQFASAVGGAIGALGGLFEQGTAAAKTAALTEIAINTAIGFVQGLDIAQKSAKATGPAAAFAFPIFYATQIGAVLSAANRARGILSAGKSSGAGGGMSVSNPSVPQAPSFNVVGVGGANQIAQTIGAQGQTPVRAYVVSQDVTTQQALDRNIVKSATLG